MSAAVQWSDDGTGTTPDGFKVDLWGGKNPDEVVFRIQCPPGSTPASILSSGRNREKALEMINRFIAEAREKL